MSRMMMEDQTLLVVAPPSHPGVPLEHRAGEADRRQAVSRAAETRLGARKGSREKGISRIKEWLVQVRQSLLLPLQDYPVRRLLSGDMPVKDLWRQRGEGLTRSRTPSVAGRLVLQGWM